MKTLLEAYCNDIGQENIAFENPQYTALELLRTRSHVEQSDNSVYVETSIEDPYGATCERSNYDSESKLPSIVVDGATLDFILKSHSVKDFLSLVQQSSCVVCARMTPRQKSTIVSIVKKHLKKQTLAIGKKLQNFYRKLYIYIVYCTNICMQLIANMIDRS